MLIRSGSKANGSLSSNSAQSEDNTVLASKAKQIEEIREEVKAMEVEMVKELKEEVKEEMKVIEEPEVEIKEMEQTVEKMKVIAPEEVPAMETTLVEKKAVLEVKKQTMFGKIKERRRAKMALLAAFRKARWKRFRR